SAACRHVASVAGLAQRFRKELRYFRFIVNDNCKWALDHLGRNGAIHSNAGDTGSIRPLCNRGQHKLECGTAGIGAVDHLELAALSLRQTARDRQAYARTDSLRLGREEGIENTSRMIGRYTRTVIRDEDMQAAALVCRADPYFPMPGDRLQRLHRI